MDARDVPRRLRPDELRDVDQTILRYLDSGRVTPVYCRLKLEDDGKEYSRGYVQERLARLADHQHIENLKDTGLYELVEDPRDE